MGLDGVGDLRIVVVLFVLVCCSVSVGLSFLVDAAAMVDWSAAVGFSSVAGSLDWIGKSGSAVVESSSPRAD